MLTSFILAAVLVAGADPAPATASKVRVLVLDFKPSGGVEPNVVENITGLSAAILSEDPRLEVIAGPDLRSMINLQAQKESSGCTADAQSCVAELAGALDAKLVVIGNVGYLGKELNLNIVLFDQRTGQTAGRRAVQAKDLSELSTSLREPLHGLVDGVLGPSGVAKAPAGGLSPGLIAIVAGGAGVVVGAVLLGVSALPGAQIAGDEQRFVDAGGKDATALADASKTQADWFDSGLATGLAVSGGVLVVAGAGAVVAGFVMGVE